MEGVEGVEGTLLGDGDMMADEVVVVVEMLPESEERKG